MWQNLVIIDDKLPIADFDDWILPITEARSRTLTKSNVFASNLEMLSIIQTIRSGVM